MNKKKKRMRSRKRVKMRKWWRRKE